MFRLRNQVFYHIQVRMFWMKLYKWRVVVLLLLLLTCLLWSFVNYISRPSCLDNNLSTIIGDQNIANVNFKQGKSLDVVNVLDHGKMLIDVIRTSKNFDSPRHFTNLVRPTPLAKAIAKPAIDIVNDYYPFLDFKFVFPEIFPEVETEQAIFMIVLVNSGAKGNVYRKRRAVIRETWGNQNSCEQLKASGDERLKNLKWLLVFVVGKAGPGTNDDELNMAEAKRNNDMLIGNITDNYINNIIKFYMGQVWASRYDIQYTMKADDDVYVRIPRVLEYLANATFPKPFYGGKTSLSLTVSRVVGRKWTISWKYFGEVNFPRFNYGAFIILSSDLLNKLFNYVYTRKPFPTDDAYVGVAMRDMGVKITTIFSFAVQNHMSKFVRKGEDCQILRMDGFAHNVDPQSSKFLHNRLTKLACESSHKALVC